MGFIGLLIGTVAPSAALDVTSCGQMIPDFATGDLVSDLTCPGGGLVLGRKATLRLNGFTLSGSGTNGEVGVFCGRLRCAIQGPGTIRAFGGVGVLTEDKTRIDVSDLVLRENGIGLLGGNVRAKNVLAEQNDDWGLSGRPLHVDGVQANDNGLYGIGGFTVTGSGASVSGNGDAGVSANRIRLSSLTATGNAGPGIRATFPGAARLRIGGGGGTWGVCSAD